MASVLLRTVVAVDRNVRTVLDPFAGSGTTLVESMRLGLDYFGQDINPLAVLICRAKAGPFHIRKLVESHTTVVRRAKADRQAKVEADFAGIDKWFSPEAQAGLSKIRRAIRLVRNLWCRRVLWTALAEVVRLTSNSRTSTFKLHVRPTAELMERSINPVETFDRVVSSVVARLQEEAKSLVESGCLTPGGWYRGLVTLSLGDSAAGCAPSCEQDLLVTSPPYGDNVTTVPYGQYSYLPLQWIDLADIDECAHPGLLRTTHDVDARSLGGSRKEALSRVRGTLPKSPALAQTLAALDGHPADRACRVAAYAADLDEALDPILGGLRRAAFMLWTVGNRRVGAMPVPTDAITAQLLEARGCFLVAQLQRRIPSKRMATRNNIASTMRGESILVLRKG